METSLPGQLRMEGGSHDLALLDRYHAAVIQLGDNFDVWADTFDDRRTDEDRVDLAIAEDWHVELRFEAVQLSTKGIALHGYVEQWEDWLVTITDVLAEQDHAGAGAEQWSTLVRQVEDRLTQSPLVDQLAHGRALAAGEDQPADALEVAGQT